MSGDVTLCFYLVIGVCVAIALWLSEAGPSSTNRTFRATTAFLFWPLYLPLLLSSQSSAAGDIDFGAAIKRESQLPPDEMASAITQVESELDAALCSLNGWAEEALCAESGRFVELRTAWRQQAEKIRELDRLLIVNEIEPAPLGFGSVTESRATTDRIASSEHSRRENLSELKVVRQQWHDDLLATLASVRQLVTMIHVARYTGAPASRAAELVQQIAKTVEGSLKVRRNSKT